MVVGKDVYSNFNMFDWFSSCSYWLILYYTMSSTLLPKTILRYSVNLKTPISISFYKNGSVHSSSSSANSSFDTSGSCETTPPNSSSSVPTASSTSSSHTLTPLTTVTSGYHQPSYHQAEQPYPPYQHHYQHNNTPVSSQMKPYRPWGAEVAYWRIWLTVILITIVNASKSFK